MIHFDEHIFQLGLVQPPTSHDFNRGLSSYWKASHHPLGPLGSSPGRDRSSSRSLIEDDAGGGAYLWRGVMKVMKFCHPFFFGKKMAALQQKMSWVMSEIEGFLLNNVVHEGWCHISWPLETKLSQLITISNVTTLVTIRAFPGFFSVLREVVGPDWRVHPKNLQGSAANLRFSRLSGWINKLVAEPRETRSPRPCKGDRRSGQLLWKPLASHWQIANNQNWVHILME